MRFRNRTDAGRQLVGQLTEYTGRSDVIVLGLPRGGIPVAYEVATRLKVPLDVFSSENSVCPAILNWRWGQSPAAASKS